MLELKNITKVYPSAGEDVHALKGINKKNLKLAKERYYAYLFSHMGRGQL